jgi:hypothetical protein
VFFLVGAISWQGLAGTPRFFILLWKRFRELTYKFNAVHAIELDERGIAGAAFKAKLKVLF